MNIYSHGVKQQRLTPYPF